MASGSDMEKKNRSSNRPRSGPPHASCILAHRTAAEAHAPWAAVLPSHVPTPHRLPPAPPAVTLGCGVPETEAGQCLLLKETILACACHAVTAAARPAVTGPLQPQTSCKHTDTAVPIKFYGRSCRQPAGPAPCHVCSETMLVTRAI